MPRFLHYSDVENVYDDPERAGRLAGTITALGGDDALVVGTGDNTSPGVVAMVAKGHQAVDFFRAVDADLSTFGNHDFDYGPDETRALLPETPQTWVSANVRDEDGGRFGAAEGVVPWTVEEVDGVRVGFFGVTDPATDSLNPSAADLTFTDPYEAAERAVSALRDEGVDRVVALSHLGGGDDELARRVDVDVVLGGHVHSERVDRVDGTVLTRPGVNGETVLEVVVDEEGVRVERHDPADGPENPRLAEALRSRVAEAGLDEVVATVERPIERSADVVHGGECRVGNFVADAYRWATDADVALQNSGGIRAGPPLEGAVTVADLVSVIPFEEQVVLAEVTGAELLDAFRQMSAAVVDFGEAGWWHGHVSGARIVWDDDAAELVEATVAGETVDPDRLYTVAMAEYLLHSDHEFPAVEERHRAGEFGIQHEQLAAYARERGIDPAVEGRIERMSTASPAEPSQRDA
ncbi:2',3'-cyclic-nucleotide 2'-phosphodiesterase/5'-or 3'-nucleotidase, 5'-nucleotidase family [Halogranum amylolyticum]|uniref:2',3'-cyclic-nucleotide 2'-phosphodiesterase/5'-or 3'-nucleotidase, 5'-nucleotidase family n=1 Tax=Halogranum amylolyticum TaxID=660520 RepID=A0A1H8RSY3_9EURY|nr:5'-nucleotidase C-terminal domain-containing protein [Halogranum amylolyticum]SEO69480.1 2',3'-cyclic-nucleotide 2'-phosphodiesterase/5'-or 3'-nucleotidase, 5'-nucleotidase family [Halogranum amylolyticum]